MLRSTRDNTFFSIEQTFARKNVTITVTRNMLVNKRKNKLMYKNEASSYLNANNIKSHIQSTRQMHQISQ